MNIFQNLQKGVLKDQKLSKNYLLLSVITETVISGLVKMRSVCVVFALTR